jgi:hypothetical protein
MRETRRVSQSLIICLKRESSRRGSRSGSTRAHQSCWWPRSTAVRASAEPRRSGQVVNTSRPRDRRSPPPTAPSHLAPLRGRGAECGSGLGTCWPACLSKYRLLFWSPPNRRVTVPDVARDQPVAISVYEGRGLQRRDRALWPGRALLDQPGGESSGRVRWSAPSFRRILDRQAQGDSDRGCSRRSVKE